MFRRVAGILMMMVALMLSVAPMAMAADGIDFSWQDVVMPLIGTVLTVLGVLLGRVIVMSIGMIKNTAVRGVVWQVVLWVEQRYQNAKGEEKFRAAMERVANKIPFVDIEDIEEMIEAAVGEMNKKYPKVQSSSPV